MTAVKVIFYLLYVLVLPGVLSVRVLRVEGRGAEAVFIGAMFALIVVPFLCFEVAALTGVFVSFWTVAGVVTILNAGMAAELIRRRRKNNQGAPDVGPASR